MTWSTLSDTQDTKWPTRDDLRDGLVADHPSLNLLAARLKQDRRYLLEGAPRSGKSTLARMFALQSVSQDHQYHDAIFVEVTELAAEDFGPLPTGSSNLLVVIEDLHAKPELSRHVESYIESLLDAGTDVLVTNTRVRGDDPGRGRFWDDWPIISVDDSVSVVAQQMIDARISRVLGLEAGTARHELLRIASERELLVDDESYEAAFVFRTSKWQLPNNLRVLRWRLNAWRPTERRLSEVLEDDLAEAVEDAIRDIEPTGRMVLLNVAAVAQWGVPYQPELDEVAYQADLVRRGVIVPSSATSWRMDQTDAFLHMAASPDQDGADEWMSWRNRSADALKRYIDRNPRQGVPMLQAVGRQRRFGREPRELMRALVIDAVVADPARDFIRGAPADDVLPFLAFLVSSTLPIEDDHPLGREVSDIVLKLLPPQDRVATLAASIEQPISIWNFAWLLRALDGLEGAEPFVRSLLKYYPVEHVRTAWEQVGFKTQRFFARRVGAFDPEYINRHSLRSKPKPFDTDAPFSELRPHLANATATWGPERGEKIEFIESMDEEYLSEQFREQPDPAAMLQNVLQTANWLAPAQAHRLAALVPQIWSDNGAGRIHLRSASWLLLNAYTANPQAADDLLTCLRSEPLRDFRVGPGGDGDVSDRRAAEFGRLAITVERVRPGTIWPWLMEDRSYIEDLLGSTRSAERYRLVEALTAIDPRLTEEAIADYWTAPSASDRIAPWRGLGMAMFHHAISDEQEWRAPFAAELSREGGITSVFAVFGVQQSHGNDAAHLLAQELVSRLDSTWLPVLLGRRPMPWTRDECVSLARVVLRSGQNPRLSGIDAVALAGAFLPRVEWSSGLRLVDRRPGHRALATAMFENIMHFEKVSESTFAARLSQWHPVARDVQRTSRELVDSLGDGWIGVADWRAANSDSLTPTELDSWQGKLLQAGLVECTLDRKSGEVSVRRAPSVEPRLLLEPLGLVPES